MQLQFRLRNNKNRNNLFSKKIVDIQRAFNSSAHECLEGEQIVQSCFHLGPHGVQTEWSQQATSYSIRAFYGFRSHVGRQYQGACSNFRFYPCQIFFKQSGQATGSYLIFYFSRRRRITIHVLQQHSLIIQLPF